MTRELTWSVYRYAPEEIGELNQIIDAQRAEIERLKAGIREYACTATDHPCGCYDQFLSERAEIERLKTALGPGATVAWEYMYDEIERLQAALQPFAKMYAAPGGDLDKAIQIARAALEPKP